MIYLTETAAERAANFLETRDYDAIGLRLGVKTSGCSGFAYVLEVADQEFDTDEVFEDRGIKIYVDKQHLIYIDGTTLDWQTKGLNAGFAFINPNETGSCGCGESFSV